MIAATNVLVIFWNFLM